MPLRRLCQFAVQAVVGFEPASEALHRTLAAGITYCAKWWILEGLQPQHIASSSQILEEGLLL